MSRPTNIEFSLPIEGVNEGVNVADTPSSMSNDMGNVRALDVLEQRLRIGQRPGMAKAYPTQIASAVSPVVWIGSVSVVDYLGD